MDPFRIICPACSTKLVVRQPELVGRTVPCPKCKNAIHVVRPGEVAWNPGSVNTDVSNQTSQPKKNNPDASGPRRPASTVNSEAITKADPGDWDIDALESALAQQNPLAPSGNDEGFFRESNAEQNTPRKKETEPFEIQPLDPANASLGSSATSPSAWQSPQAKSRRQLLTVFVVGLSGCLLAALAFLGFLNAFGKRNRDKPAVENQPALVENQDPVGKAAPQPELIAEAGPQVEAQPAVVPGDPSEPVAEQAPGLKVNPLGIPPENTQPENGPSDDAVTPDSANPIAAPMNLNTSKPDALESSPKSINPDQPAQDIQADAGQSAEEKLPAIFKDFLPVFDRSSQPGWSDLGKEGDKTIDQELALENADSVFAQEYFPQPIPLPNWSQRSERKLGRIRMPPMRIPRFVQWLNRISGHAISIDWFLFNISDISLDQSFELQSDGTTIAGLLDEFKAKVGVDVDIDSNGFVYIRPLPERLSTKLKPDGQTDLGPLAKGLPDGQDQAIVQLVCQMLQIDGCEYRDGKLVWGENSNAYQQAQVLAALASVREAIGGGVQADLNSVFDFNRPAAWMKLISQSQIKLAADAILFEERPVVDILATAAQSSQMDLLFDWPAVWSHGLHPNRMALSLLRGRNLLEISARFLDDHSLELVPLNAKTWMLTTEDQRRSMIRLIAVRTDQGVSLDDMRVSVRGIVPRSLDGRSMFQASAVPGTESVVLLRICPPSSSQLADQELVRALGQAR